MKKGGIAAVAGMIVLAGVLAVAFIRRPGDAGGQVEGGNTPQITFAASVTRVVAEVESGIIEKPFVMVEDPAAGGGLSVELPENPDKTELNPKTRTSGGEPAFWKDVDAGKYVGQALYPNGAIRVPFEVLKAGDYSVWFRAYWLHGCANSVYFMIDPRKDPVDADGNGEYDDEIVPVSLDGAGTYKVWHWVRYGREGDVFHLDAGRHEIVIYNREDGVRLDQVLFAELAGGNQYYPTGVEESFPAEPSPDL
ncbi:MAG: hypothetical protein JW909_01345 [Planctomycetes bacterium]|nr:hypothetical protein [Planctomycetota bacterium]